MKSKSNNSINIILAGVGGQGILALSSVLVSVAFESGLNVLQSEIHGMSQRGGSVYAHLRISKNQIYSNLIPKEKADLIVGVEPLETLRYVDFLRNGGKVIVNQDCVKNIVYPNENKIYSELDKFNPIYINAKKIAKGLGNLKVKNMILLGVVIKHISSHSDCFNFDSRLLKKLISKLFKSKGKEIVLLNIKAFEIGYSLVV